MSHSFSQPLVTMASLTVLPIEIVREIFEYLPIPNNELFGEGDGGAEKWRNLKNLKFEIVNSPREQGLFQQFEYNPYHKCIQFQHLSVRSLIDCYFRPPFFPAGLELRIGSSDFETLLSYGFMLEKFRIQPESTEVVNLAPESVQFSLIETDDLDLLASVQYESLNVKSVRFSQLIQLPLKELVIDEEHFEPLEGPLRGSLEKLTLRINNNKMVKDHLLLNLDFPKLKLLTLSCRAPCKMAELVLPSGLEELMIEGHLFDCKMNFPPELKVLQCGDTDILPIDPGPSTLFPSTSFPSLRSLSIGSTMTIKVDDLPKTLSSLTITSSILEGDLRNLPNLTKMSIFTINLEVAFQHHKVDLPLPNSFTFKLKSQTYSIKFQNLTSLFLSNFEADQISSYPESLRTLELRNSPQTARCWPSNLKGLRILYSQGHNEKIVLPESLEMFQLLFDLIDNYSIKKVKHLYQSKFHFEPFIPPNNLISWCFTGNICSTEGIFDLSNTKVSRLQYVTTGRIDNTEIILPSSLRRLETNKKQIFDDSRVNHRILRDLSVG